MMTINYSISLKKKMQSFDFDEAELFFFLVGETNEVELKRLIEENSDIEPYAETYEWGS